MEGASAYRLFKLFAPKVPGVLGDAALHTFGLLSTSEKWDLKTTVIMSVIRAFLNSPSPTPIGRIQKLTLRDPGIKGPMWISKQTFPAPEESDSDVLSQLEGAINAMASVDSEKSYQVAPVKPVEIEWTGSRPGVGSQTPRPDLDEDGQYKRLMSDTTSDLTILYIHGGALYLMDPASHRTTCARLAKHTGGRCASVRYRLAPQNPFPAALLDVFVAFLSLMYPPPGAIHAPVEASKIVFAGDSAGGTLSLALLQLILQLHRQNKGNVPSLRFHGKSVQVLTPGGIALMSPWVDLTRCLPTWSENAKWDYLPGPRDDEFKDVQPDDAWPANPPRGDLYCELGMLTHPLVNPMAATDWNGTPPTFICVGQECLTNDGQVIARRIAKTGAKVELLEFEAMPHVFTAIFEGLRGAQIAMEKWAAAAKKMCDGIVSETQGTWIQAKTLKEKPLVVLELAPQLPDETVFTKVKAAQSRRTEGDGHNELYHARL